MTDTPTKASIPVQHMRHDLLMALRRKTETKVKREQRYHDGEAFGLARALMYLAAEKPLPPGVHETGGYSGTFRRDDYQRLLDFMKEPNYRTIMGESITGSITPLYVA